MSSHVIRVHCLTFVHFHTYVHINYTYIHIHKYAYRHTTYKTTTYKALSLPLGPSLRPSFFGPVIRPCIATCLYLQRARTLSFMRSRRSRPPPAPPPPPRPSPPPPPLPTASCFFSLQRLETTSSSEIQGTSLQT